jgi:hypothetical protein
MKHGVKLIACEWFDGIQGTRESNTRATAATCNNASIFLRAQHTNGVVDCLLYAPSKL